MDFCVFAWAKVELALHDGVEVADLGLLVGRHDEASTMRRLKSSLHPAQVEVVLVEDPG